MRVAEKRNGPTTAPPSVRVLGKKTTKDIAPPPPPSPAVDSDDEEGLAFQMEWARRDYLAEQVRLQQEEMDRVEAMKRAEEARRGQQQPQQVGSSATFDAAVHRPRRH